VSERTILFISKGEQAASTRYRVSDYLPFWSAAGWKTAHLTHDGSLRRWVDILRRARHADVVVIVRRTFSLPMLRLLRAAAPYLVFDFDDAIFVRSSGEHSGSKLARFGRTLAACDQVWAGNAYLAENAARFNDRVTVIPTAVEAAKYQVSPAKPTESVDLVWIGSSSTRKHLMTILPALEIAAARIPALRLKVIADFAIESAVLQTEAVRWSADGEATALASSHIGIAPLPDNEFTRGKCGLKILQYMAAGLPVVASPVGVNADLVQADVTGYTARTDDEWINAIERLASDPRLRERLGEEGRRICQQHYVHERVFQQLQHALSNTNV
jgi:glycosyltransferase involved in cell wall biosynthesis